MRIYPSIIVTTALLLTALHSLADNENLAVSKIPESLKKNANAIVRDYTLSVEVTAPNEVLVVEHKAITILNKRGKEYAPFEESYNADLEEIKSVGAVLYDEDGHRLSIMKKSDILDIGLSSSNTFYDNLRTKVCSFPCDQYPYTCVYDITYSIKTTYLIPAFLPQTNPECAIQAAKLIFTCPKKIGLRYKCLNTNLEPRMKDDGDNITLLADFDSIAARPEHDEYTPANLIGPHILLGVATCRINEFEQDISTWQGLGKLAFQMNDHRIDLSEKTRKEIHDLSDTCTSVRSKASILYTHLQETTRYLQIYLGIGGWQAHPAAFVAEKGYGDCKDLSNYMHAMLKEAGITSYLTLACGGNGHWHSLQPDFASPSAFNHMILCVPDGNDTIWLECTSKILPSGFLSGFTSDKNVLLLAPDGGHLVHTPVYTQRENFLAKHAVVNIDAHDSLRGEATLVYSGDMFGPAASNLEDHNERHKALMLALPTYRTDSYSIKKDVCGGLPTMFEHVTFVGNGNITHTGNRMFLEPNVFRISNELPKKTERTEPFVLSETYQCRDTTDIFLPDNYQAEILPQEVHQDYPFGSLHSSVAFDGGKHLRIVVVYTQKSGTYEGKIFSDYCKTLKERITYFPYGQVALMKAN